MKQSERIIQTLKGRPVSPVCWGELVIDDRVVEEFWGRTPAGYEEKRDFILKLEQDLVCLSPVYEQSPRAGDLPDPDRVLWPDLESFTGKTDLFVLAILDGGYSWGLKLMGLTPFMLAMMREPETILAFMDRAAAFNQKLAARLADSGVRGVVLADDIAYNRGLMVDPAMLRQMFFPALARQVDFCRELGLNVFFHSDGNLNAVLDDLAATEIHGLQCLESAAGMDLAAVQTGYSPDICLWGNLDPALLTGPLDEEKLSETVAPILEAAAKGGVIFGTSSGLFAGIRKENLLALYRLLRQSKASPNSILAE